MSKTLEEFYSSDRIDKTDSDFPHGKYKNESAVGAKDGTPYEKGIQNQFLAATEGLLNQAGISSNGLDDTPNSSQVVDAVVKIAQDESSDLVSGSIATQAEAEAGTNDTKIMTPKKTVDSIKKNIPVGTETQFGGIKIYQDGDTLYIKTQ